MTFLEQQEAYADLEPYWDGTLEASGAVAGLSRYTGRSSIYHSPAWPDELLYGECKGKAPGRTMGIKDGDYDEARVLAMLRRGTSYNGIARELHCSPSVPRRVGRKYGVDRRSLSTRSGHHPKA